MWANEYVGIPWLDGGRTKAGCDCYGLVRLVLAEQFALTLDPHEQFYHSVSKDRAIIAEAIHEKVQGVPWRRLADGVRPVPSDVALFIVGGAPIHCGVMITPTQMLHVRAGCDTTIESVQAPLWAKRLEGFYRYHG